MSSIYHCLLRENLSGNNQNETQLKEIVETYINSSIKDAQGLFDRLCELNAWTTPPENEDECCVDEYSKTYIITLKDGTPAGLLIIPLEEELQTGGYHLYGYHLCVYELPDRIKREYGFAKTVHDGNEDAIMEAKKVLIRRVAELLNDHFDGILKFSAEARIRLDKYDMESDMVTPTVFHPSGLMIEGTTRKDCVCENVILSYTETEFNSLDDMKHACRWTDNLKDLSLSDIQDILYKIEEELKK